MVLKIKKKLLVLLVFLLTIPIVILGLLFVIPPIQATFNQSLGFYVWVNLGNAAPYIFWVNQTLATDPTAGSTTTVAFSFNASDANGVGDLNPDSVSINITLGAGATGELRRNGTSCSSQTVGSMLNVWCSVTFFYYDNGSNQWIINTTIADDQGSSATNSSLNFTYNTLGSAAITGNSFINFTNAQTGQTATSENPLIINNTGNFKFTEINLTGTNVNGTVSRTNMIGVGNFSVNVSAGPGGMLVNTTAGTIKDGASAAKLIFGAGAEGVGNLSLTFYINVPSAQASDLYNSSGVWNITLK